MKIYLDNAATTKVDKKVLNSMKPYFSKKYANASSLHINGSNVKKIINDARNTISKKINSKPEEIYFTSGATESNNLALKGLFFKNYPTKNHIITSKIEHSSILETCKWLEKQGAKITYLNVDKEGFINLNELKKSINPKTFLISIMHANNEIGTIQNIEEIGKISKEKKLIFHTDATQSFTKIKIDVKKTNIDLLSASAHKIHGPKGIGFIYIKENTEIIPLLHGGGQERRIRSGTENIPGIVGLKTAIEISNEKDNEKIKKLREILITNILKKIPNTKLNGPEKNRLQNNLNISFMDIEGEAITGNLENKGIYVSTGSACMSNTLSGSHVLKAIQKTDLEKNSSIRFSLSKFTTKKQINYLLKILPKIVKKLRELSPVKK